MGGEVSEYVIILVDVNDTIGLDERDPYVADAVIVFTIDNVISFETDCCMECEDERETERDGEVVCE